MTRLPWRAIVCACWAGQLLLVAQTKLDLRTQANNVDFTQAATTKPNKAGAALPDACSVGESFFLTSATAGRARKMCRESRDWCGAALRGSPDPDWE